MKKSIQILDFINKNGPKSIENLREVGIISKGKEKDYYYLVQRGFLKTAFVNNYGIKVCDITTSGKEHVAKEKRGKMFVPVYSGPDTKLEQGVKVTVTSKTKMYVHKPAFTYEVYATPKNFMQQIR